jgi:dinuclear metal center YbgI/SA1388 family protein
MKIADIIQHLEATAPLEYQEEYDNSGIQAGDAGDECTGVLVSLDCTEDVVKEAIQKKCNLIVSHHPLIFRPVRNITPENSSGRMLTSAIRAGITLYAIHTKLDNIPGGVNATIADRLSLTHRQILCPRAGFTGIGSGLIGNLEKPVSGLEFLEFLREAFHIPVIRHSPLTGRPVSRIALCGGAGSFLISNALQGKADFFITGDIKYHHFFEAGSDLVIADIGHFESEQFTMDLIRDVILKKFRNFAVLKSGTVTNPVHYYI